VIELSVAFACGIGLILLGLLNDWAER